jgi:hypothetical protein
MRVNSPGSSPDGWAGSRGTSSADGTGSDGGGAGWSSGGRGTTDSGAVCFSAGGTGSDGGAAGSDGASGGGASRWTPVSPGANSLENSLPSVRAPPEETSPASGPA